MLLQDAREGRVKKQVLVQEMIKTGPSEPYLCKFEVKSF